MSSRVPKAEQARIDPRKLRDYALNTRHAAGQYKAAFFAQMGYTADDWQQLERDLRDQHLTQSAESGQSSPYGRKYTITAPLRAERHDPTGDDGLDLPARQQFRRTGHD